MSPLPVSWLEPAAPISAAEAAPVAIIPSATPILASAPVVASAPLEHGTRAPEEQVPPGNPVLAFAARVTSDACPDSREVPPALEFSMETETPQPAEGAAPFAQHQNPASEPTSTPAGQHSSNRPACVSADKPYPQSESGATVPAPAVGTGAAAAAARASVTADPKAGETSAIPQPADAPDPRRLDEPGAARLVREVSIRIVNENSQTADVKMTERNGEIQVAVHASDSTLASSLRNDVSDLVHGLASTGAAVEIVHAGSPGQANTAGENNRQSAQNGSQNQQRNGQDGASSGHPQQRGGEGGRGHHPWLDDFETISGASQVRRNGR